MVSKGFWVVARLLLRCSEWLLGYVVAKVLCVVLMALLRRSGWLLGHFCVDARTMGGC